jgi:hypothetical protein
VRTWFYACLWLALAACSGGDGAGSQGKKAGDAAGTGAGAGAGQAGNTTAQAGQTAGNSGGADASVGVGQAGTGSFGQLIPRTEFCARAPGSGIQVPDARASTASAASTDPDAVAVCTGDLAKRTFRFGLCSCQDLILNGTLTTDAFNSARATTSKDGSVGVRTRMEATSLFNIGGSLWVAGLDAAAQPVFQISGSNAIAGEMRVGGDLDGSSFLTVSRDAYVSGNIGTSVLGTVVGSLHQPSGAAIGGTTAQGGVKNEPVTIDDPCNCDKPLDVETIVSAFATVNDNAASGIATTALIAPSGTALTLECGRYYFEGIDVGGTTTLHLTGRTAIFVKGDFKATSLLTLQLDPGAELDLFVTGNIVINGASDFGSKNAPARIRLYVGGTEITLVSLATLGANIYARRATVTANGTLSVWGSLYANRVDITTLADFHYDTAILETEGCEPPDLGCTDCQSCSGGSCIDSVCAPCRNDADCCAPLGCSNGACVPINGPE